jgi:DNA-binding Xre family transcriptional regulator
VAHMPVRWKVQSLLRLHGLSTYRLWKESGLAMGTVYRLARGETTSLNVETLDRVMEALLRLTGKPVALGDLLEYESLRVYIASTKEDAEHAVLTLMEREDRMEYVKLVDRHGVEGAIQEIAATWVERGVAFREEDEALGYAASKGRGAQLHVHAIMSSHIRMVLDMMGLLAKVVAQ